MGRDKSHPFDLSTQVRSNAETTVQLVNKLIQRAKAAGVTFELHPVTGSVLSSGWRPPSVNANTPRAAARSKHITGQACDIYDPDGDLDEWLMTDEGQKALVEIGLWHEHPSATKGWAHVQTIPPNSKRRTFYP
jgi:hypothetical protein